MACKESKRTDYDVMVVGGGPAGATCAWFLGRTGLHVALLDAASFPRPKICGDGWGHRRAVPILQELGVLDALGAGKWRKIDGMVVGSPSGARVNLSLPPQQGSFAPFGVTCRRDVLDAALWQQASCVTEVLPGFRVRQIQHRAGGVMEVSGVERGTAAVRHLTSRLVVGADGARSVVARALGNSGRQARMDAVGYRAYYRGVEGLTDQIEVYFLRALLPGYCWVFPIGAGQANIGIVAPSQRLPQTGTLEERLSRCLEESSLLRKRLSSAQRLGPVQGGALPAPGRVGRVGGPGVLLIGDAAGLIDPWLWEGLGNALFSGKLAAEVVISSAQRGADLADAFRLYRRRLHQALGAELARGAWLQRLAHWPALLNFVVHQARRMPQVAQWLSEGFVSNEAHGALMPWRGGWRLLARAAQVVSCLIVVAAMCAVPIQPAFAETTDRAGRIAAAIERGLTFLQARQRPSGSFIIYNCADRELTQCSPHEPSAGAIAAVYSLARLNQPLADEIKGKAQRLLRSEQGPDGLWRYELRSSPAYAMLPPDLDDTSVAALGLLKSGVTLPGHAKQLLAHRNPETGLFPSWVVTTDEATDPVVKAAFANTKQTIDCVVNANILAYLTVQGEEVPAVCALLNEAIAKGLDPSCSPYYPRPSALAYSIGRAYASGASCLAPAMPAMQKLLLARQTDAGDWGTAFDTTLITSALLNIGYRGQPLDRAVEWLLNRQQADGSWPRGLFYISDLYSWNYGSEELTTLMVLEALELYRQDG